MNEGPLSSMTKAMIEAARTDAPSAAARAKMWSNVSSAIGGGAAAAGGAAGAIAGSAGAAKLLVLGALFGGTLTVGLAVTMLRVGRAPSEAPVQALAPVAVPIETALPRSPQPAPKGYELMPGANVVPIDDLGASVTSIPIAAAPAHPPALAHASEPARPPSLSPEPARASSPQPVPVRVPERAQAVDPLAREAQLVSEARSALGRGDTARALEAVRAARALPSHQLAPEEMAVEAQALRALGRAGEADTVDEALRVQFPESALAR